MVEHVIKQLEDLRFNAYYCSAPASEEEPEWDDDQRREKKEADQHEGPQSELKSETQKPKSRRANVLKAEVYTSL